MPRPLRPDGRPRGTPDKAYASLLFNSGVDPDCPGMRAELEQKFRAAGMPAAMVEQMVDEALADAAWAQDGSPTI